MAKRNPKNVHEEMYGVPDGTSYTTINGEKLYNTAVPTKRDNFPKFAKLISNQFEHGGDKYNLTGQVDKETTDLVCELAPGKTGIDWILQTIVKYVGRYMTFQREKDLLKIATYCYIAWLKKGYHLKEDHDEDVKAEG